MKLKLSAMLLIAIALLLPVKLNAQQILAFKFTYLDNGKQLSSSSTTTNPNLEKSIISRGKGAQDNSVSSVRSMVANMQACKTKVEATKYENYFEFFLKAKPGYTVSLKDLKVILRAQQNSANTYRWAYSLDEGNSFTDLGQSEVRIDNYENDGSQQQPIDLSSHSVLQNLPTEKKVVFRLYAWGGSSSSSTDRAFGIGKSSSQGSNAISLTGYVVASK